MAALTRREFLRASAAGAALVGAPSLLRPYRALAAEAGPAGNPIEHIVVVMMENRSFDHFLGWLPGADGQQGGLTYLDSAGAPHATSHWAPDYKGCGHLDPGHGWNSGRAQLQGGFMAEGADTDEFALIYYD